MKRVGNEDKGQKKKELGNSNEQVKALMEVLIFLCGLCRSEDSRDFINCKVIRGEK